MNVWRVIKTCSKVIEVLTKPTALVLATLGLIAVYVPDLRQWWEKKTMPQAWYEVGTLEKVPDGSRTGFFPANYDSPVWSHGFHPDRLFSMAHTIVLTNGTAVGRADPMVLSDAKAVLGEKQCLYVERVDFAEFEADKGQSLVLKQEQLTATKDGDLWPAINGLIGWPGLRSCQALTKKEAEPTPRAPGGRKGKRSREHTKAPSYDESIPVCKRVNVWIKARKLTC